MVYKEVKLDGELVPKPVYSFCPLRGGTATVFEDGDPDSTAKLKPRERNHDCCCDSTALFDLFHHVVVSAAKEVTPDSFSLA